MVAVKEIDTSLKNLGNANDVVTTNNIHDDFVWRIGGNNLLCTFLFNEENQSKKLHAQNVTLEFYNISKKGNEVIYNPTSVYKNSLTIDQLYVNEFKSTLQQKIENSSIDDTLDYIFNTFDDLLLNNNFSICNSILKDLNVLDYDIDIIVGILTITAIWKENLPLREVFFQNSMQHIFGIAKDEVFEILDGLD